MENERPNVFPSNEGDKNKQNIQPPQENGSGGELTKEQYYAQLMAQERAKNQGPDREPEYVDLGELGEPTPPQRPVVQHEQPKVTTQPNPDPNPKETDYYVEPDFGSDFDIIPLPSQGKCYKHKKGEIKVSYLTAGDENILTNPNLVKSGKFLDILFQRKIIDTAFKYEELLQGDKDAIMLWLRSTAYGSDYTIQVFDPEELEYFDVELDLNDIKTKHLGAEPDEEGLFDFTLPIKGNKIKFKMLTVGDLKQIHNYKEKITKEKGEQYVDLVTFTLKTVIVEVDGNRDRNTINHFCEQMRIGDSKALKKYVDKIECGKNFFLTVTTPGGSQVKTYFPINHSFYWPES